MRSATGAGQLVADRKLLTIPAVAADAATLSEGLRRRHPRADPLEFLDGHTADAVTHLEHMILTYPESALVPQARRELELARSAIPSTS